MLQARLQRIETLLARRAAPKTASGSPVVWTVATCVQALRALLRQVAGVDGAPSDPFPEREGEAYVLAFWPWFLAHAEAWPPWAQAYARQLAALALGEPGRLVRRHPPAIRRLQTVQDVIDLLEEQAEVLRADDGAGAVAKARAVGYLAGQARQAIATGQIAARIDMLETVLQQRQGDRL